MPEGGSVWKKGPRAEHVAETGPPDAPPLHVSPEAVADAGVVSAPPGRPGIPCDEDTADDAGAVAATGPVLAPRT